MKRLYQKIYITIVVTLLLVVAVAGAIWRFGAQPGAFTEGFEVAGELAAAALPPASAPAVEQQEAIDRLAKRLKIDLTLFDETLRPLARWGRPLPPPTRNRGGWIYGPGGPAFALQLPDQRWIVAGAPPRHAHPALGLVMVLGAIALVIALCAFPVVRGLTRRLERLQEGVETLGSGDLSARVKVEGRDEVARLAKSFNQSAERIEELVNAHRLLLAHASHEIRTPLSRIRLGIELMQKNADPKYKAALEQDIAELDGLVDDILLASRLDMARDLSNSEPVDLLALAAEEASHYDDCHVGGDAVTIAGDARLLRQLIRNLLDNAARHGKLPVNVAVRSDNKTAYLDIIDSGPGIPMAERERVFIPFYRLSGEAKGSGLGLSIARQIARLHGGDIVIGPQGGQASCIRVTLPVKI